VRVHGVVTRRTSVFPQLATLWFTCKACNHQNGPLTQSGDSSIEVKPMLCQGCQGKGPFVLDQQQTEYRNYQKITLQVRHCPNVAVSNQRLRTFLDKISALSLLTYRLYCSAPKINQYEHISIQLDSLMAYLRMLLMAGLHV
jgi:hypothetical protein